MSKVKDFLFAALMVLGISVVGTVLLYREAAAQTPSGFGNLVVYLGTAFSGNENMAIGTGANKANSGAVLGSVYIGSATSGGPVFTVYDSSTSALGGKYVIGTFSCASPFQFSFNQAVQYGLWIVNGGCKFLTTYLPHK